jgi:hypothetical protein
MVEDTKVEEGTVEEEVEDMVAEAPKARTNGSPQGKLRRSLTSLK